MARLPRRAVASQPAGAVRVFDADPDLLLGLDEKDREAARRHITAGAISLPRGVWNVEEDPAIDEAELGLLVLDGFLTREADVAARASVELLGEGDVLFPDVADADGAANVRQTGEWQVYEPTRLAVLRYDLVGGLARRCLVTALARRAVARSRALALRLALAGEPQLDRRLELLLWHLADRRGRRRLEGVHIEAPLTRGLLAKLIGAHPTAVSKCLSRLAHQGLVSRPGGVFVLHGEPPAADAETGDPPPSCPGNARTA